MSCLLSIYMYKDEACHLGCNTLHSCLLFTTKGGTTVHSVQYSLCMGRRKLEANFPLDYNGKDRISPSLISHDFDSFSLGESAIVMVKVFMSLCANLGLSKGRSNYAIFLLSNNSLQLHYIVHS